jgi:hypothetical protein
LMEGMVWAPGAMLALVGQSVTLLLLRFELLSFLSLCRWLCASSSFSTQKRAHAAAIDRYSILAP